MKAIIALIQFSLLSPFILLGFLSFLISVGFLLGYQNIGGAYARWLNN